MIAALAVVAPLAVAGAVLAVDRPRGTPPVVPGGTRRPMSAESDRPPRSRAGETRSTRGRSPKGWSTRGEPAPGPARRTGRRASSDTAAWAHGRQLAALRHPPSGDGRLVVGRELRGRWTTRRAAASLLSAEPAQSLAVIGPTQSGKTTALAVPAILGWDGPVLAASVKSDLLRDTVAWRRAIGQVWCFDPAGATGFPADRWSPLVGAVTWPGARRLAADLTEVARREGTSADGEFWYATASKLLGPLLLAAALGGLSMGDVVRWVDTQETEEVFKLLEGHGAEDALQALRASWLRDERQRSSVYTTAETVLEPFVDLTGEGPAGPGDIDPGALLDGPHTLYLCAPAHDQRRLQGLFVALVKGVLEEAFTRSVRQAAPLRPPLLVVLDEAANIAPLAELDSLAATCAGHGVQLVTVWQDLAQVTARYGVRAATVVNNHRAKLFLSGISDPGTLDHASRLVGDEELLVPSVTHDAAGGRSTTMATARRPLLPPDALRRLPQGTGVLVYGSLPPVRVALQPWWEDRHLAGRVAGHVGRDGGARAAGERASQLGARWARR